MEEKHKRYYLRHREEILEKKRAWRKENLEEARKKEREYYKLNREKLVRKSLLWSKKNPEKIRKRVQKWRDENREEYREKRKAYLKKYYRTNPWARTYHNVSSRCGTRNHHYYKRNIKNYLTIKLCKELWFRDGAAKMKDPSIDRKDTNGNYTFENCRYIEFSDNIRREKAKPLRR